MILLSSASLKLSSLHFKTKANHMNSLFAFSPPLKPLCLFFVQLCFITNSSKGTRQSQALLATCLHSGTFLYLSFWPEDGGDVLLKRRLTFNGLHCVVAQKVWSWHALAFRIPIGNTVHLFWSRLCAIERATSYGPFRRRIRVQNRQVSYCSTAPPRTAKSFTVRRWVAEGSQLAVARVIVFSVVTCRQYKFDYRGTFIYYLLLLFTKENSFSNIFTILI
jgi:hypothetical protein